MLLAVSSVCASTERASEELRRLNRMCAPLGRYIHGKQSSGAARAGSQARRQASRELLEARRGEERSGEYGGEKRVDWEE